MFLISDDVGGTQTTVTSETAEAINYAASISLYVKLQDGTKKGRIYPPYLKIKYKDVQKDQLEGNKYVAVSVVVIVQNIIQIFCDILNEML